MRHSPARPRRFGATLVYGWTWGTLEGKPSALDSAAMQRPLPARSLTALFPVSAPTPQQSSTATRAVAGASGLIYRAQDLFSGDLLTRCCPTTTLGSWRQIDGDNLDRDSAGFDSLGGQEAGAHPGGKSEGPAAAGVLPRTGSR
jgi:hypothetical protein